MTERDPAVAGALATLEVPEHGPRFWDDLDGRLASATAQLKRTPGRDGSHTALPHTGENAAVVVDLGAPTDEAAASPSPRRRLRTWLPAAALIALIAAIGVQVVREPDDAGPDLSVGRPDTQNPVTTVAPSSKTPPTTAVPLEPEQIQRAQDAAVQWLDALGQGDVATAASLLGPRSEGHIGTFDPQRSIEDYLRLVASEGFGGWGRATDREIFTIPVGPGEAVVVVNGTIELEGTREQRADAFPVVYAESADAWFVDPWASGSVDREWLEALQAPERGKPWPVTAPVAGRVDVYVGAALEVSIETAQGNEPQSAILELPRLAPADDVVVTVVFTSVDGSVFLAESRVTG